MKRYLGLGVAVVALIILTGASISTDALADDYEWYSVSAGGACQPNYGDYEVGIRWAAGTLGVEGSSQHEFTCTFSFIYASNLSNERWVNGANVRVNDQNDSTVGQTGKVEVRGYRCSLTSCNASAIAESSGSGTGAQALNWSFSSYSSTYSMYSQWLKLPGKDPDTAGISSVTGYLVTTRLVSP